MTDEVWNYLLSDGVYPSSTTIPKEKIDTLKTSFEYWYPMNLRSSAKDLVGNHLTFCLYVHCALFEQRHWPESMRLNGHLIINGEKMSKSTGNFMTLRDSVEEYGADATRFALCDSGDGIHDANFEKDVADSAIKKLHTYVDWCQVSWN
jgi:leucyl-tRNA synthetase